MLLSHSDRYPGDSSSNGVEKVWLHRSFLATLECGDAVTTLTKKKWLCRRCEHAVTPHGEGPPDRIARISASRDGRLKSHPQFGCETPATSAAPTHRR